jgi:hypothetical protein
MLPRRRPYRNINGQCVHSCFATLELLWDYNWHINPKGYPQCTYQRETLYLHRLVLEWKLGRRLEAHEKSDHINQNKLDNHPSNLRPATGTEQSRNRGKQRHGKTSRYQGVSKCKKGWIAKIEAGPVKLSVYFKSELRAALWRDLMAIVLHGPFASLNDPSLRSLTPSEAERIAEDIFRRRLHP